MQIGHFSTDERVLIVAEVGNNHEGKFEVAKDLVRRAAECGVDAVKFQTFRTEYYVSSSDTERFERLKSFELTYPQFEELSRLAHSLGLLFFSTPFDLQSAEFLETIVDCFKIASGDNTFYPLIERVAQTSKPMMISLGGCDAAQVGKLVSFVKRQWGDQGVRERLAILHCVSSYPAPPEQANLRSIPFLHDHFDCTVGYSDHTIGIEAALVAAVVGARIIEKHFTLDKGFSSFRDHQLSADPADMRELVPQIRLVDLLFGQYGKTIEPCEWAAINSTRRSIAAVSDLPQGHRLGWPDLMWIRPAGGLAPGEEHLLVGKVLKRGVGHGEQLRLCDVE